MAKFTLKGDWETRNVWLNGHLLAPGPSQRLRNHSPDGFNWGYGGSGPAQLALAALQALFSDRYAEIHYQDFKWKHIATLPQADFDVALEYPMPDDSKTPGGGEESACSLAR